MDRSGSEVRLLQMYWQGVSPPRVLSLRARLEAAMKSARSLQLVVVFMVGAFDGRFLDSAVHPFDLTVPRENDPPDRFLILGTPGWVGFVSRYSISFAPQIMSNRICLKYAVFRLWG